MKPPSLVGHRGRVLVMARQLPPSSGLADKDPGPCRRLPPAPRCRPSRAVPASSHSGTHRLLHQVLTGTNEISVHESHWPLDRLPSVVAADHVTSIETSLS